MCVKRAAGGEQDPSRGSLAPFRVVIQHSSDFTTQTSPTTQPLACYRCPMPLKHTWTFQTLLRQGRPQCAADACAWGLNLQEKTSVAKRRVTPTDFQTFRHHPNANVCLWLAHVPQGEHINAEVKIWKAHSPITLERSLRTHVQACLKTSRFKGAQGSARVSLTRVSQLGETKSRERRKQRKYWKC